MKLPTLLDVCGIAWNPTTHEIMEVRFDIPEGCVSWEPPPGFVRLRTMEEVEALFCEEKAKARPDLFPERW
jgi:hypothetical protein